MISLRRWRNFLIVLHPLRQISSDRYHTARWRKESTFNPSSSSSLHTGWIMNHHRQFFSSDSESISDLDSAMDDCGIEESWKLFENHILIDGFPRKSTVTRLISRSAETLTLEWLNKSFTLVERGFEQGKEKRFDRDVLIYLSFSLSKCGMHVPASTIIRKLISIGEFPPLQAWSSVVAHMAAIPSGAFLAAELVLEIGYLFQDRRIDPRKKTANSDLLAMKPDTSTFNIAIVACILSGLTKKADQLLLMIPRVNIKPDTTMLVLMAHVHDRNGNKEELKKLHSRLLDDSHDLTDSQFLQFHNCLLSSHMKFNDLDSASHMVLQMLIKAKKARNSLAACTLSFKQDSIAPPADHNTIIDDEKHSSPTSKIRPPSSLSFQEFSRDRWFARLKKETDEMLSTLLGNLHPEEELLKTEQGFILPTEQIYLKLVKAFLEGGKINRLTEFLIRVEKEESPDSADESSLVQVARTCISLGWLEQAHDLLDEMRVSSIKTGASVYSFLLQRYCHSNRGREAMALLRDAQKAGVQLSRECYESAIKCQAAEKKNAQSAINLLKEMREAGLPRKGDTEMDMLVKGCGEGGGEARLMQRLLGEIREGKMVDCGVHDWNNIISFFCRKHLMKDAEKALRKMRGSGHVPNAQTFHSMVTGYAAEGRKYAEVLALWGEMKAVAMADGLKMDQELLDSLLYVLARGGFFVRAVEVLKKMERDDMFVDKYKYRILFLKYHKSLYRGKAPDFQTESQLAKREAALEFKKWVGLL